MNEWMENGNQFCFVDRPLYRQAVIENKYSHISFHNNHYNRISSTQCRAHGSFIWIQWRNWIWKMILFIFNFSIEREKKRWKDGKKERKKERSSNRLSIILVLCSIHFLFDDNYLIIMMIDSVVQIIMNWWENSNPMAGGQIF